MADLAEGAREQRLHHTHLASRRRQSDRRLDRPHADPGRRADPRGEAGESRGLGLHGRDPAERHARRLHRNLAGERRRRLHPAQRPRRCRADPAREECGASQPARHRHRAGDSVEHPRARDRSGAEGKGRPECGDRQDRYARTETRAGRDPGGRAPGGHDLAGAAQHRRRQGRRYPHRKPSSQEHQRQRRALRRCQPRDGTEVTEGTAMKFRANKPNKSIIRALTRSAAVVLALHLGSSQAADEPRPAPPATTSAAAAPTGAQYPAPEPKVTASIPVRSRFLPLGVGKSVVINLPRDVKDVLVADPKIANAVIRSSQRAYIIGSVVGQTNVVFFDADGQQVASYDIAVKRDLNGIRAALHQTLPGVQIEGVGEGVMLTGSVSSPVEAQQAGDIAARLVGGADKVVNSIVVRGRDQVMLKVHVAEVRRDIIKQMGIDLSASMNYGTAVVNFNNSNPFTALGSPLVSTNGLQAAGMLKGLPTVSATLRAMESAGVIRTLAEPNLTAISGESATFVAGGEFPIPAGYSCDPVTHVCTTQITYKKFGISLNFTPVVLSEGRISLRVMTEVSELSNDNAITLSQALSGSGTNSITIPSIRTRRAETTLEIPSGGSMAMAGLIQQQTKQAINGMPGIDSLPILGALFPSQDYVNNETELMLLVTPYVVRAVPEKDLSRPDDGFAPASDSQSALLARMNRIYGIAAHMDPLTGRQTNFGFFID